MRDERDRHADRYSVADESCERPRGIVGIPSFERIAQCACPVVAGPKYRDDAAAAGWRQCIRETQQGTSAGGIVDVIPVDQDRQIGLDGELLERTKRRIRFEMAGNDRSSL